MVILLRNPKARIVDPNSIFTSVGERFHNVYDSRVSSDGTIKLSVASRKDIKAEINSHAAETDMSVIINKLMMGDTSVLTSKPPMFGDFTEFPKTYAEVLDIVNRSEKAFQSLPQDIKAKYDNDRNKWFAAVGSDDWLNDMGLTNSGDAPVETPIVKPVSPSVEVS